MSTTYKSIEEKLDLIIESLKRVEQRQQNVKEAIVETVSEAVPVVGTFASNDPK